MEGIDTTEGTAANAGYFDFGSFEEFQVGGAGADAGAFAGGAVLSISVKSGGDRFAGTWYSDYVSESQLTDNVPDYLKTANTPDDDGHFSRRPRLPLGEHLRGNAVKKQYDLNGDVGGPIVKQKAWFFTSWRLNDKYAYILGLGDTTRAVEALEQVHLQGHVPGQPQQPDHRLPEQAREAAGQARHQPDHAALGRLLPELAQLSVEGGMDQRARQPRVPRRALRQLVQLLPAAPGPRLRPV